MNRKNSILVVMLAVLMMMTSCLGDNESEGTYYNDAAITAFSLGTLKRIAHTKTKYTKVDSTYETTVSCSSYAFSIDHEKGLIYNLDSLPAGTCADKALVTISTLNSGYVYLKSFTSDSLYLYSSASDSLDFSKPRVLQVLSTDGTYLRTYTVDVRVHKEVSDSVYWNRMNNSNEIAALENMHAVVFDNTVIAYGTVGNDAKAYATGIKDGQTWSAFALPSSSAVTMATNGKMLYALADGKVYAATSAASGMQAVADAPELQTLVAASRSEVYAISKDKKMMKSQDNGATWYIDATDDDLSNLPERDINGFCKETKTNADIDKVFMIGNHAVVKDSCCIVWSKVVDNGNTKETQPWMYQPFYSYQWHNGLALYNMSVAPYNDGIIMLGGSGLGACTEEAFSGIFVSEDDGQNWSKDDRYQLPADFSSSEASFAMVTDGDNRIWILCGGTGQVWKGYLSQLTWK